MSGKGHHRRSKHYSGARSTVPVSAFREQRPLRIPRAKEAILLECLIMDVWSDWLHTGGALEESEVDAVYEVMKRLSPGVIKRFEKMLAEHGDILDDEGLVPTMRWAAVDWICRLELPKTERELWEGPPLVTRLRPSETGSPSAAGG